MDSLNEHEKCESTCIGHRSFVTADLPDDTIRVIATTRMDTRHDALNELLESK